LTLFFPLCIYAGSHQPGIVNEEVIDMWIAVEFGNVTVLFNTENEESLSWLKKAHGVGETREEAIRNLEERIPHD
jgi:hypothetical protein